MNRPTDRPTNETPQFLRRGWKQTNRDSSNPTPLVNTPISTPLMLSSVSPSIRHISVWGTRERQSQRCAKNGISVRPSSLGIWGGAVESTCRDGTGAAFVAGLGWSPIAMWQWGVRPSRSDAFRGFLTLYLQILFHSRQILSFKSPSRAFVAVAVVIVIRRGSARLSLSSSKRFRR